MTLCHALQHVRAQVLTTAPITSPPTGAWPCSSCGSVGDRCALALACKCSPRRQGTHGHLMAMLLVWLRGELWDQHGAPLALPLGLGCAGNCGFVLVPLAHPKIVSEIMDWCWRPADVASCRACVGTRVVPCQWGLRSCPTRGGAWCAAAAASLLPRRRPGARHSDGERKPLAND